MTALKSHNPHNPFFIFDFDGTIADTHRYIVEISNRMSKEFGYDLILPTDIEKFKDRSAKEMIHVLNVPLMKIPAIIARGKKEFSKGALTIEPIKGLKEVLIEMHQRGARMGILSSNSTENIEIFLKNHNLNIFSFIHSTPGMWSKNTTLKKILNNYKIALSEVIYVGDETRDIIAAKKMRAKIIAVSWGYNSRKVLAKNRPTYIIDKPEELLKFTTKEFFESQATPRQPFALFRKLARRRRPAS